LFSRVTSKSSYTTLIDVFKAGAELKTNFLDSFRHSSNPVLLFFYLRR
jgi:hypothetical protein